MIPTIRRTPEEIKRPEWEELLFRWLNAYSHYGTGRNGYSMVASDTRTFLSEITFREKFQIATPLSEECKTLREYATAATKLADKMRGERDVLATVIRTGFAPPDSFTDDETIRKTATRAVELRAKDEECMGLMREMYEMVEQDTSYAAAPRINKARLRAIMDKLNEHWRFKP